MTNPIEKDEPLRAAVVTAVQNFLAETRTGSFCLNEALPGKLILAGEPAKLRLLLGMAMEDAPALPAAEQPADEKRADEIVTALYRRFKDWSKRGFGPDDVTWCEVKADVMALIHGGRAAPVPESQLAAPWISVQDRKPETMKEVLVWEKWSTVPFVGWWTGEYWTTSTEHYHVAGDGYIDDNVSQNLITHWMPIPAAPAMEAQSNE